MRDDKPRGAILRRELVDQIHTCHKSHYKGHMSKCFLQLVCCGEWAVWEQNRTYPRVQDRVNLTADTLWVNFLLWFSVVPQGSEFVPPSLQTEWSVSRPPPPFRSLLDLAHFARLAGSAAEEAGQPLRGSAPFQGHVSCCACRTCRCGWETESWECTEQIPHTALHPSSAPTLHTSQDLLIQSEVGGGRIVRGNNI